MFLAIKYCNSRYTASLSKVQKALEQPEENEGSEEEEESADE